MPAPDHTLAAEQAMEPVDSLAFIAGCENTCDTLLNTDLAHAIAARYSTQDIDTAALKIVTAPPPSTWLDGLEGTPRAENAGDNSGVLAIITGMFLLIMLAYNRCRRLFSVLVKELSGMRTPNLFDERTSNESGGLWLMALQWSVYTGLLLYTYLSVTHHLSPANAFADTVKMISLTAGYYVFQYIAYNIMGYTFSTPDGRRYLVEGFTASQSLLGFTLIVPALVAIFYHEAIEPMLITGATLYLLARIVFVTKGFRIFYQNFWSLLYFILYLCTLEIIPLIVLYKIALLLVNSD